ncbi:MAG: DUF4080 domain-containing protein [Clostridiaceae bacterium]|jgi:radical SAM superfamily enzyme YgiQ (UPF0313 family)|nr:DUF4080 domain-containing protein [Bacillota bacterium]NLN51527.1 DUF4080 domain-containing protein [Clostridiaceae bacterium]
MSKVVLVALNSSYSHTNLAIRYIREKLTKLNLPDLEIFLLEKTINDHWMSLFDQLLSYNADIYAFSCYIWNRSMVESLAKQLKRTKPEVAIVWAGPDVSSQAKYMFKKHPWLDGLIQAEGDSAMVDWICRYLNYDKFLPEKLVGTSEELAWEFPYTESELQELNERILYYEGSRGCSYNCTYCLSANTFRVRYKPLNEVLDELKHIIQFNPRQLKFIDRTFNSDPKRSFAIWQFLIEKSEKFQTRTNFHFEIAAELLNQAQIDLLATARPGLFQFEIGAQTTNPEVLKTIRRPYRAEHYRKMVRQIRKMENIHLHLDLIAGLPGENLISQIESANDLLKLYPNMLQMGFLKVLPDTQMKFDCDQRDMIYQDFPPYEILKSDAMSAEDLMYYRKLENLVGTYYNSGHYFYSINLLLSMLEQPFSVFILLYDYLKPRLRKGAISRSDQTSLFHKFGLLFLEELKNKKNSKQIKYQMINFDNNQYISNLELNHKMEFWLEDFELLVSIFTDLLKLDYFLQGQRGYPDWFTGLSQSQDHKKRSIFDKATNLYRESGYRTRGRFEAFSFSVEQLLNLNSELNTKYSGAGDIQPYPEKVLQYLEKFVFENKYPERPVYVSALKLGQGPIQVIKEYQL